MLRALPSQHCYSNRLLRPFARLLRTYPNVPPEVAASIDALDEDGRTPIAAVHELLRGAILLTGDEEIGLKAAEHVQVGDYGALEYVAGTALTGRDAFATVGRYMHLINDGLTFSMRDEGDQVVVLLENAVVMPRAAEDFELAAFFASIRSRAPVRLPFEVRFVHPAPADTHVYERVFGEHATVRFGQPFSGFIVTQQAVAEPLPSADAGLHRVIRSHADRLLEELPRVESLTTRVREELMSGLASGKATLAHVASQLHLSERTLARRLEDENTSFKPLLDDLRRRLALRYVGDSDLAFSEIAFLLGFSQVAAFHRAFKRWTEQTPLEYRTARRG